MDSTASTPQPSQPRLPAYLQTRILQFYFVFVQESGGADILKRHSRKFEVFGTRLYSQSKEANVETSQVSPFFDSSIVTSKGSFGIKCIIDFGCMTFHSVTRTRSNNCALSRRTSTDFLKGDLALVANEEALISGLAINTVEKTSQVAVKHTRIRSSESCSFTRRQYSSSSN